MSKMEKIGEDAYLIDGEIWNSCKEESNSIDTINLKLPMSLLSLNSAVCPNDPREISEILSRADDRWMDTIAGLVSVLFNMKPPNPFLTERGDQYLKPSD